MNELTCFIWNYSKKTGKLSKNDKFVINKTKNYLFYYSFNFLYEIKTKLSVDSFYFSCHPFRKPPDWH